MKIDIAEADTRPGTTIRKVLESIFGNDWINYKTVYIDIEVHGQSVWAKKLHSLEGPVAEKYDGTKEWWIKGKQFTEQQFNSHIRNKAFW